MNKVLSCLIFYVLFSNNTWTQIYLQGGYSKSIIKNFNDDKDSKYYPSNNFIENSSVLQYQLAIGYKIQHKILNYEIELGYKKLGAKAKYNNYIRPTFDFPFSSSFIPDLHIQGLIYNSFYLSFSPQFKYKDFLNYGIFLAYSTKGIAKITNEFYYKNEYIGGSKNSYAENLLNKHLFSIGPKIDFKIIKTLNLNFSYDYYLTSINKTTDAAITKLYHPHLISIAIKILVK